MRLAPNRGAAADGLYVLSYGMEVGCAVSGGVEDKADGVPRRRGAGLGAARSVERAAQILRLLGDSGGQGVADLASALRLSKGTVHGLLQALASSGLVRQDPESERYGLGPGLVYLGSRYLLADEVRVCSGRWARLLAKEIDHIVQVGTLHGFEVLIVNHIGRLEDSVYSADLGSLQPAHRTAVGKVLLAHCGPATDTLLGVSYVHQTASDQARLRDELACVCKQGWAVAGVGVEADQASIACPIVGRRGEVVGAIGAVGPAEQLLLGSRPQAGLLERVRSAAVAVSCDLGGPGW
jgi:DNA-binding IclR family transcriptional regulator